MRDAKDLFHDKETLVGYVETSAGGILLTDGGWEDDLPLTTQESLSIDLNIESSRIPVIAVRKNDKRFLILALDDAIKTSFLNEVVETIDKVEIPKDEEEGEEKKAEEQ
jgi:hypothetical protein